MREDLCDGLLDLRLILVLFALSRMLANLDAYIFERAEEYESHTRGTSKAKILDLVSHRTDEIIPAKNSMGAMFLYEWVWRTFYNVTHAVFCVTVVLKVLGFNMEGYGMLCAYFV